MYAKDGGLCTTKPEGIIKREKDKSLSRPCLYIFIAFAFGLMQELTRISGKREKKGGKEEYSKLKAGAACRRTVVIPRGRVCLLSRVRYPTQTLLVEMSNVHRVKWEQASCARGLV